jgi:hypothetical protein
LTKKAKLEYNITSIVIQINTNEYKKGYEMKIYNSEFNESFTGKILISAEIKDKLISKHKVYGCNKKPTKAKEHMWTEL